MLIETKTYELNSSKRKVLTKEFRKNIQKKMSITLLTGYYNWNTNYSKKFNTFERKSFIKEINYYVFDNETLLNVR